MTAARVPRKLPERDLLSEDPPGSVLFPLNRESALVVLGGLCVSSMPAGEASIPMQDGHIVLLTDGLRVTEQEIISAGDPRRFPMLLEFPSASVDKGSEREWFIPISELKGIVFRSKQEADDFRFRPVDEVNTEALPFVVNAAAFDLPGEPRFSIETSGRSIVGQTIDRIAAGVHCVVALADASAECRSSAIEFFATPLPTEVSADPANFHAFCTALMQEADSDVVLVARVPRAFASGDSASEIINRISASPVPGQERTTERWADYARGVLQNRIELSGEHLADDGSILLRGSLLALAVDSPAALGAFLRAEKPAGTRVAVMAAFLLGLKVGVLNLPWSDKQLVHQRLSRLTAQMLRQAVDQPDGVGGLVSATRGSDQGTIVCGGLTFAEWQMPALAPMPLSPLAVAMKGEGYDVLGTGRDVGSIVLSLGGHPAELVPDAKREGSFCVLRVFINPNRKLRKKSDIAVAFGLGGTLWYPGALDSEAKFLFCDLPHLPRREDAQVIVDKLKVALEFLLVAENQKRPARVRKPKAAPVGGARVSPP